MFIVVDANHRRKDAHISFIVGKDNVKFHAQKLVLSAYSPVFKALLIDHSLSSQNFDALKRNSLSSNNLIPPAHSQSFNKLPLEEPSTRFSIVRFSGLSHSIPRILSRYSSRGDNLEGSGASVQEEFPFHFIII